MAKINVRAIVEMFFSDGAERTIKNLSKEFVLFSVGEFEKKVDGLLEKQKKKPAPNVKPPRPKPVDVVEAEIVDSPSLRKENGRD